MGAGVVLSSEATVDLANLRSARMRERPVVVDLLVTARPVRSPHLDARGRGIPIWIEVGTDIDVLRVGRLTIMIRPFTASRLATVAGRGRPVDVRGVVTSLAGYVTPDGNDDESLFDIYNADVALIRLV